MPTGHAMSSKPIPYVFDGAMQHSLNLTMVERLHSSGMYDQDYPVLLPSSVDPCHLCGTEWAQDGVTVSPDPVPVMDKKTTFLAKGKWYYLHDIMDDNTLAMSHSANDILLLILPDNMINFCLQRN